MRLFLAVAVLMLALVAYTEAQDEETFDKKISAFREQVVDVGRTLAEKAKTVIEQVNNSDMVTSARSWLTEGFETLKKKFTTAQID
ncbi:apolipoprotein C-I [Symphorus nematophorus]